MGIKANIHRNSYVLFFLMDILLNFPLLRSSWSGDDWPNSQTPYWIEWRYGDLTFHNVLNEALYWNKEWMIGTGRFYPLAFIESRIFFSYFQSVQSYKLLQFAMMQILLLLFLKYIYRLTQNHNVTIIFGIIYLACIQFRNDFDPHLGFSLLLPSLMIKILVSELFLFKSMQTQGVKQFVYSLISSILLFASFCTYEYALLISPFVVASSIMGLLNNNLKSNIKTALNNKILPLVLFATSIFSYLIFVFGYLRPKAKDISGAYVLGLSWKSIPTFIVNCFAGIPLINFSSNDLQYFSKIGILLVVMAGIIILLTKSINNSFMYLSKKNAKKSKIFTSKKTYIPENSMRIILFIGLLFTFMPALMLSMQETWWNRIKFGHSYLGVFIQEIGIAFLVIFFYIKKINKTND